MNSAVLAATGNPTSSSCIACHACTIARTGAGRQPTASARWRTLEVVDEVFESAASVVFDQAENRVHTSKALMVATLGRKA